MCVVCVVRVLCAECVVCVSVCCVLFCCVVRVSCAVCCVWVFCARLSVSLSVQKRPVHAVVQAKSYNQCVCVFVPVCPHPDGWEQMLSCRHAACIHKMD